jgi:hypothetical protein
LEIIRDITELRQVQEKAIAVLEKFGTVDALNWLLNCTKTSNPFVIIKSNNGEIEGKRIYKHIYFENDGVAYDAYLVNEKTFETYDSVAKMGDFIFYCDTKNVLETSYHVDDNDGYGSKRRLSWLLSRDVDVGGVKFIL